MIIPEAERGHMQATLLQLGPATVMSFHLRSTSGILEGQMRTPTQNGALPSGLRPPSVGSAPVNDVSRRRRVH